MKKLAVFLLLSAIIFASCEQSLSQKERKLARQRAKERKEAIVSDTTPQETKTVVYYEPAPVNTNDGNSYWFVVVQNKNGDAYYNSFIVQNHRYFSAEEAKQNFGGNVFIMNFIQVSKETFEVNNQ